MQDESMRQEWVHCPVCGNKTSIARRYSPYALSIILSKMQKGKSDRCKGIYCKRNKINKINKPDAKTQCGL